MLLRTRPGWSAEKTLDFLAEEFRLGAPFRPPLYAGMDIGPRYSRVSSSEDPTHPAFNRNDALPLHCDGTLQPLGMVKCSALFCETPAGRGGETIFFNAVGAFFALLGADPAAAHALTHPTVRTRTANLNGSSEQLVGPGFIVRDGQLCCGYTVAKTDRWAIDDPERRDDLRRALDFMDDASRPGSPYRHDHVLGRGTVILFDNTRLSHGRNAFTNHPDKARRLHRGLFLEHPTRRAMPTRLNRQWSEGVSDTGAQPSLRGRSA